MQVVLIKLVSNRTICLPIKLISLFTKELLQPLGVEEKFSCAIPLYMRKPDNISFYNLTANPSFNNWQDLIIRKFAKDILLWRVQPISTFRPVLQNPNKFLHIILTEYFHGLLKPLPYHPQWKSVCARI